MSLSLLYVFSVVPNVLEADILVHQVPSMNRDFFHLQSLTNMLPNIPAEVPVLNLQLGFLGIAVKIVLLLLYISLY